MIILKIFIMIVCFIALSVSTRLLIASFKQISRRFQSNEFALSNLIIGMGTSIPELIIALECVWKAKPGLSLGNVLGSNIADLSLVIGGATLLAGRLKIIDGVLERDVYYTFLLAAAPLLLLSDGELTRLDGIILLLLYLTWQSLVFSHQPKPKMSFWQRLKKKLSLAFSVSASSLIGKFLLGLAGLLLSAEILVRTTISLATALKIPNFILGVFVLGVGSSLPELAFESRAIKNKEGSIVLGDLLGSVVTNSSFILGLTALLSPLKIFRPKEYFTVTLYFLFTFSFFYTFIKTKKMLEKWEAAFLVTSYFILLALEFG